MVKGFRPPPLRALRVFEAAARTGSLTLAARDLNLTHSAVSQQIKMLEGYFGRPLFVRGPRGVEATAQAKVLYEEVRASLDRIALAAEQFAQSGATRSLRVNATASFAMRWLIPRLSSFQLDNPRVQVLITTSIEGIGELKEPFDVIIRRSPMSRAGFECRRFLDDVSGPLASPGYLARNPVPAPEACLRATLLHLASRRNAWQRWLALAGVNAPQELPGAVYEHFFLSLQAASSDLGLAIGSLALCEEDLAAGRLVRLFPDTVIEGAGFHMLYRAPARPDQALRAFVDWLGGQGGARG
jgi:LysR family glycine cleavage system transcriptional activator